MTLASQVSIHLGQPVSEHKGELGINLTIPGVSLFVRNGQEVCPEACANTLRIMAEKRTYRDHLNDTLKEELPDDLKRLLERLNSGGIPHDATPRSIEAARNESSRSDSARHEGDNVQGPTA